MIPIVNLLLLCFVISKASTSYIQRRLGIGYNRAATLIERMEGEGIISPANDVGKRKVLGMVEEECF